MEKLEDALRPPQVFQAALSEIEQRSVRRQRVTAEFLGRPRQQHLSASPGGHQVCGAVAGRPVVVTITLLGVAGVQAHPSVLAEGVLIPSLRPETHAGR